MQVLRWIDARCQDWKSRSGLCLRSCGFGSVASGLRGFGAGGSQSWTFMQVKGLLV